jgi:hypothetical protein
MPKYKQERAVYGLHFDILECEDERIELYLTENKRRL